MSGLINQLQLNDQGLFVVKVVTEMVEYLR
jgi:hypothetical protein